MRRVAVAALLTVGIVPWIFGVLCLGLCVQISVLARALMPDSRHGNCWTYAMPRWYEHGGWMMIRWSEDVRLFGLFRIPHAVWLKRLPDEGVQLESFSPTDRKPGRWFPWHVLWFHGHVKTTDNHSLHNVKEPPCDKPT